MDVRERNCDGPATELIFGDWYPAARTDTLRVGKITTSLLLGVPLLLGRKNDGKIFAMKDLCPHRGIPLSAGWFDGETVMCKYHGWRFEPCGGQCREIPSLTQIDTLDASKIYATSYPCEERDGYAWVYLPAAGSGRVGGELPDVPELPKFSEKFRSAHLVAELPCNVDEPIPEGFRMSAHAPSGNSAPYKLLGVYGEPITTTIDFVLPNRRYETIRCGAKWFSSLTTVTPITPSTCRIDVIAAWNVFYHVPFVTSIATFFGARFVGQDQQTMIEQAQGLRYNPGLMLIDDADKPAKWYFALKQARLKGTGEHPLSGPVTLHWRS
jgi:nitrite reductase/ring-hydroxylating ferredoxin subunit